MTFSEDNNIIDDVGVNLQNGLESLESVTVNSPLSLYNNTSGSEASSTYIGSKNFEICSSCYNNEAEIPGKAMFRAVIMQALLDSVNNSKRTEDRIAKQEALEWFDIDSNDFVTVCQFADWNPVWVINEARQAISRGCKRYGELKQIQEAEPLAA